MSALTQSIVRRPAVSALALICAAQFVLQLDFSIVNVALPTIQRELGFVAADLQWVVTGYALTFGSLLLLGGRAGDLLGRRRLLLLIPRAIPDDKSTGRQRIDVLGGALVTASAAALIYGLSSGEQQGFGSLGTVLALVAAVLLALVFVLVEAPRPLRWCPSATF